MSANSTFFIETFPCDGIESFRPIPVRFAFRRIDYILIMAGGCAAGRHAVSYELAFRN
jgi:hypothetical protein